jgi:hypothetical protein
LPQPQPSPVLGVPEAPPAPSELVDTPHGPAPVDSSDSVQLGKSNSRGGVD